MMRRRDAPNRQPDADLALACDRAREQQVGDVGARDHQDEAERKKERREQQHDVGRQRDRALPRFEDEVRGTPLDSGSGQAARQTCRGSPRVPHAQLARAPVRATALASAAR